MDIEDSLKDLDSPETSYPEGAYNGDSPAVRGNSEILKILKTSQVHSTSKKASKLKWSTKPAKGYGTGGFNCLCCNKSPEAMEGAPLTSFEQDEASVSYKVECVADYEMDPNFWTLGVSNFQILNVQLVTKPPEIWLGHIKLAEKLTDDTINFTFENQFKKLVIKLQKPKMKVWKSLGAPQKGIHNKLMDSRPSPVDYYPASIVIREKAGASNVLLGVQAGPNVHFGCPVAWHIMLKVNDEEKVYTPVKFLTSRQSDKYDEELEQLNITGQVLFFIVKVRKNGKVSGPLSTALLNTPNIIEIGGPRGQFNQSWVFDTDRLIYLAGGTGLAPFISIFKFIKDKKRDAKIQQVVLVLCANTESDLIWNDTWMELDKRLDWFIYLPHVTHKAKERHISFENLQHRIDEHPFTEGSTHRPPLVKALASGPWGFTDNAKEIFEKMGIEEDNIFMFNG